MATLFPCRDIFVLFLNQMLQVSRLELHVCETEQSRHCLREKQRIAHTVQLSGLTPGAWFKKAYFYSACPFGTFPLKQAMEYLNSIWAVYSSSAVTKAGGERRRKELVCADGQCLHIPRCDATD